jgi:hypothetical protein
MRDAEKPVVFSTVTYDKNGYEVFSEPVAMRLNSPTSVVFDRDTTGFVVGTQAGGCPIDKELAMTKFSLELTVVDSAGTSPRPR